ncbi:hypothetical protein B0A50_05981 [Salinomyces thailandicus]|uniref:SPX domain-containing protein n=1 Tax=Salinomyces thailandicus TaxID=706561 RepID=A0A4U0TQC3_9PEZI|nr:hypothetical protein B0A50_05981 [Salinomyces thailandica]
MKFGHEYEKVLASEGFPKQWLVSAIDYKFLKKCIKKIHKELQELGLDAQTIQKLSDPWDKSRNGAAKSAAERHDFYSAQPPHLDAIPEEFTPQLRVLVDRRTYTPLDATLAPETRQNLQKLAQHEVITAEHQAHWQQHARDEAPEQSQDPELHQEPTLSEPIDPKNVTWLQIPLASAKYFFDLLGPKLQELEQLREAETLKLEEEILELGARVEDVVEPVREGFEAKRRVSYRDLYFWREMFRLYLENPVFYSHHEAKPGALTFAEAKTRLQAYDQQLRQTGLLGKMKTPAARIAAKQFLDLNVSILKIIGFQEMNAEAMRKILKKFDKRTHLEGQHFLADLRTKYPALLPPTATTTGAAPATTVNTKPCCTIGFANTIAHDMYSEITSKILGIVPQLDDWSCPVCLEMAWRPVSLGCCRALYCIRCIIRLQDDETKRCPACNAETVLKADARNLNFEAMDFLEKYFPLETKKRQKENETASLAREYGEEFVKPGCAVM